MPHSLISVLIVDDNPGEVDRIKAILDPVRMPNFQVESTPDLDSAIARFQQQSFNVVLLHLSPSHHTGLDILKQLQANQPCLPIVVIGLADDEFALETIRQGAQDYLVKEQITPDQLIRSLRYAIERVLSEPKQNLQQANLELIRSNQELEQFASIVSHDLRDPLWKIKAYAELLAEDYQGQLDEIADQYINYITNSVTRMELLIQDLLTYSRVNRDNSEIIPVDLNTVLVQTLNDLSLTIEANQAQITADPLPIVAANPRKMGQLFQNLISNALKFRRDIPPQIHISAQSHNDFWLITVSDNGIGIQPEYADRVFEIFQRLHSRSQYLGTGIGLAICRKIVECQGGKIWLESEFGQGTTFYFTLKKTESPKL